MDGGYKAIQSTRPQTLSYGLNDSPVGLAAWIVEKFRAWSDCGGDVERRFSQAPIYRPASRADKSAVDSINRVPTGFIVAAFIYQSP